jgi:hypothetical protein
MRYVYFVRGRIHAALCQVSMASVHLADPDALVEIYTDEPDGPHFDGCLGARIQVMPSGMPIMLANLEAQARAMYATPDDEQVAFLDTDILVLHRLSFINPTFDLAATWRDHALVSESGEKVTAVADVMPYNYGVILARGGFPAVESFIWMRERVRRMSSQLQKWYGNQVALATLAGPRPASGDLLDDRRIPWTPTDRGNRVSVLKLPCETWNYTPQAEGENLVGRNVLHFKGGKRELMKSYALGLGLEWPEILP